METESPSRRLSSGPRSSLLSASTASSEKPSRRSSNSTPSPQLSFGLKRRRSKQVEITPLPLDLDAGPVESVVGVESGSRPDTNNPLVHSASSSTIENTNDAEEELEDKEGQSPRKFRKVVGEAQAQTERPAEEGTETFHNQTYREPITPSAQLSNSGKESFSNRTQVSHSRSRSDDTSSRVEGSKMSISNMSSSSAVQLEGPSSSNPASPEGIGGFRPHSNSEAGASRPLPGSQGALTTATSALSESNQNLIHPSLAGLPGTGGGVGSKQQPSFIMKLYSMLEDEAIRDMISWGEEGQLFRVASPSEFSKHILPNYFKHSNWQSFVRQLNMYGFHKVNHTQQNSTGGEEAQIWEFKHPNFVRGKLHLLADIKRKSSRPSKGGGGVTSPNARSTAEDNDLDQSVGTVSPSPRISQAVIPGQSTSGGVPFAFPLRRPETSPFTDTRASPYHRTRPASHSGSHSRFPSATGSGDFGFLVPRGSAMGRPRAGTDVSASYNPPSPSGSSHRPLHESIESNHSGSGSVIRIDDLSDRIDQVIRHASYLETQLRTVSEQLYHSRETEKAARLHSLRMLNRLTNVCSSWCSADTREGSENRRIMLEACHDEASQFHELMQLEPGLLSPPITPAPLPGFHLPSSSGSHFSNARGGFGGGDRERDMIRMSPRMSPYPPSNSYPSSSSRFPPPPPPPPPPRTFSSSQLSPSFSFNQPSQRR